MFAFITEWCFCASLGLIASPSRNRSHVIYITWHRQQMVKLLCKSNGDCVTKQSRHVTNNTLVIMLSDRIQSSFHIYGTAYISWVAMEERVLIVRSAVQLQFGWDRHLHFKWAPPTGLAWHYRSVRRKRWICFVSKYPIAASGVCIEQHVWYQDLLPAGRLYRYVHLSITQHALPKANF